jgi:hypothetical protein
MKGNLEISMDEMRMNLEFSMTKMRMEAMVNRIISYLNESYFH